MKFTARKPVRDIRRLRFDADGRAAWSDVHASKNVHEGTQVQPKIEVRNPRLRELAEIAYELRQQVRPGTPLYWRLSNAVRGDISPAMEIILTAIAERSEAHND